MVVPLLLALGEFHIRQAQVLASPTSLQQQLAEVQRQRTANRRLMLDAALDSAEAFGGFAVSQGDLSSGQRLTRVVEIVGEIRAAVRRDDALGTAVLIAEGGRLIFFEGAKRVSEAAGTTASVIGTALSVPRNLVPAARAYLTFAERSADDARLLRSEVNLRRQLEASQNPMVESPSGPPVPVEPPPPPPAPKLEQKDFSELDKAINDWAQEERRYLDEFAGTDGSRTGPLAPPGQNPLPNAGAKPVAVGRGDQTVRRASPTEKDYSELDKALTGFSESCGKVVKQKTDDLASQDERARKEIELREKTDAFDIKNQDNLANMAADNCRNYRAGCEWVAKARSDADAMIARIKKDGAAAIARLKADLAAAHEGIAGDLERTLRLYNCSEEEIRRAQGVGQALRTPQIQ